VQGNPDTDIGKPILTSPTPAPGHQRRGLFFEEKTDADRAATENSNTPEPGRSVLQDYLPLARINLKRAIVLLVTGQAESLDFSSTQQWEVRSPSVVLQIPDQIRLTSGNLERHWKVPPVNRREVFRRDNHTCQYCGSTKHLTLDHVIPRSKGGTHTWDNVVACLREVQFMQRRSPPA
jgi:5-methylcytosine-specific restriction endonuclease McrA